MAIKIGIPRGLFYYRYFPLWKTFFEELGAEVVVSNPTTKRILDDGVKSCVDEACLPVKVFHGHVLDLKEKVDYLFIPRLTSVSKKEYICPKFGGLPDMIRNTLKNLPPLIDTEINLRKSEKNILAAVMEIGRYTGADGFKIRKAYKKALASYEEYNKKLLQGMLPSDLLEPKLGSVSRTVARTALEKSEATLRIAVISHVYNICDSYTSMDMIGKLRSSGVDIITVDMIHEDLINEKSCLLPKRMFWDFGRRAVGGAFYLLERRDIDGIIYVMSFGCGIDSFVCDLIERFVRRNTDLPFTVLTLDEHSGEAGVNTRLEAFVDMIRFKKATSEHDENPATVTVREVPL